MVLAEVLIMVVRCPLMEVMIVVIERLILGLSKIEAIEVTVSVATD